MPPLGSDSTGQQLLPSCPTKRLADRFASSRGSDDTAKSKFCRPDLDCQSLVQPPWS